MLVCVVWCVCVCVCVCVCARVRACVFICAVLVFCGGLALLLCLLLCLTLRMFVACGAIARRTDLDACVAGECRGVPSQDFVDSPESVLEETWPVHSYCMGYSPRFREWWFVHYSSSTPNWAYRYAGCRLQCSA